MQRRRTTEVRFGDGPQNINDNRLARDEQKRLNSSAKQSFGTGVRDPAQICKIVVKQLGFS
jgi:hypothetical protein